MTKIDPDLKKILKEFSHDYLLKRQESFKGLDFESLRTELAELKDRVLAQNGKYLLQFEEKARSHGSQVLRAKDSAEANRLIFEILKKHGVKKLVKSKSMVSEEIGLNEFLLGNGVEARETDLGEWIVQLARERPTHMVMPAIHLTRKEVAEIFSKHLGEEVSNEIPALIRVAREELRKEIFSAQAGLTGANALIAENGAAMLLTNEGNGRLVSTIPQVHIVLASIEKVLPRIQDADLLLKILPRNATGQALTSYVSFIAGPHRGAQYIVLVDNHRSEILADSKFREILRCIKCSACLNVCPVYQILGGSQYSHIYMGGIGSLLTAWIHGLKESKQLADLCLGCHRCEEICATKIAISDLIVALRERLNKVLGKPFWKKIVFDGVIAHPPLLQGIFHAARVARPIVTERLGFARKMPLAMKKFDRFRSFPGIARKPFSQSFEENFPSAKEMETEGSLILFAGCLIEHFYPEIGLSASRVLSRLGYKVKLGPAACCGFPSANSGFSSRSKQAFERLSAHLKEEEFIITLCPTCATMLKHIAPQLLKSEKARNLASRVFPFSQFLIQKEKERISNLFSAQPCSWRVTYHDSCHHKYFLKASEDSRRLIQMSIGKEILEMESSDACCGFAGIFSVSHPEISEALLEEKLVSITSSGAEIVALDCPGCLLQIRGGCHRHGCSIVVKHTAEILAERLIITSGAR